MHCTTSEQVKKKKLHSQLLITSGCILLWILIVFTMTQSLSSLLRSEQVIYLYSIPYFVVYKLFFRLHCGRAWMLQHIAFPPRSVCVSDTEIFFFKMASQFQSLWNVTEGSDNLKVWFGINVWRPRPKGYTLQSLKASLLLWQLHNICLSVCVRVCVYTRVHVYLT